MTMIADLRLVAAGDQWGAVVELEDGTEKPVWAVNGNDGNPPWLGDEKEYERWYNLALEEAHRQGFFLEGELEANRDFGDAATRPSNTNRKDGQSWE